MPRRSDAQAASFCRAALPGGRNDERVAAMLVEFPETRCRAIIRSQLFDETGSS